MNIQQKIKNLFKKIDKYFVWNFVVVAFLASFVVILFLNIFIFQNLEDELFFKEETTILKPESIDEGLLEKIMLSL